MQLKQQFNLCPFLRAKNGFDEMNEKKVINAQEAEVISFETMRRMDDPLRDLLEEFSHLEAEMEEDLIQVAHSPSEYLCDDLTDEEMVYFFESQLEILEESKKRLKYYLDEIETFLILK